ncbi:MAG TPA: PoNe immunity protein domain-containing protein [Rhodoblastus sp.]|nr:PoNe immunity protein domain-containing protein [Rhodoblastus sp.]
MIGRKMVRDSFKDERYFDEQVRHNDEWLAKFRTLIAEAEGAPERQRILRHTVYRRELEQLIARYSGGEPITALRHDYSRVLEALNDYQRQAGRDANDFGHFDAYVFALWIMSLAVLLDLSDDETRRAASDLDNEGRDAIFDRLRALRLPGPAPTENLIYPGAYRSLYDALDASGDERTRLILKFLDGWYDAMAPAYWRRSHQGADAGYFGYWCFELAAFVKVLGIDDGAFADHLYYPRDLAQSTRGEAR